MGIQLVVVGSIAGELLATPSATFHQQTRGLGAQEPEPRIDKIGVVGGQFADFFRRWFLEKKGDLALRCAGRKKDPEMRCHFWTDHHSKADHIGLRDAWHFLWKFQKNIPTRDEDFGGVGCLSEDAGVVIGLQIEKGLIQPLTMRPPHYGHWHERFTSRRVAGEAAALSACQ